MSGQIRSLQIHNDQEVHSLLVIDDMAGNGLIVGSTADIQAVLVALKPVTLSDEALNNDTLLSVSQAARQYHVPVDTVRHAARSGHILLAEKSGRDWRFPLDTFLDWLRNEYSPRRQATEQADRLTDYGRDDPAEAG